MRITYLLPVLNLAGGTRSNAQIATLLHRRGHRVVGVYPPARRPSIRERVSGLVKGKEIKPYVRRPPSYFDGSPIEMRELDRYRPITADDVPDADAIIATWWETAPYLATMPPSKGAPVYMIRHHETLISRTPELVAATYRMPFHKVTISRWLVDVMRDEYGDSDVSLVPNSVDTEIFNAPPRQKAAKPTVGFMISRELTKGTATGLAVLEQVHRRFPDLRVMAFGFKKPTKPLPAHFTFFEDPPANKLAELYGSCDAFLFTSTAEGFGRPALEAMACRAVLVSTAVGGPVDFVRPGENGFLSPIDDVQSLAENLGKVLMLSPQDWRKMSDDAYHTATRYSWEDAAALMEKAIERAIERRRAGQI
jgi:glycosyltransferase involved in cell wall biosynthesis